MRPYYYNDQLIDIDDPDEVEETLINHDDLLVHNGEYYFRFDELCDIIQYMIEHRGFVKAEPEDVPRPCMAGRRIK